MSKTGTAVPQKPCREPIAIIGIGCRYPGASGPGELWKNLMAGREYLGPYSEQRFVDLDRLYEETRRRPGRLGTDRGGFLPSIDGFDAQFFEISPRESIYIDPQHRLLLEVAWEALEDAGQVKERYQGSATGVYAGLWTSEYEMRLYESGSDPDLYSVTGCGRASASGRLSFAFGFEGPSVTVDTACSSSLVAVQMACEALWSGEIDMALAGGANLILGPEISELFTKAKMLSPDGHCKFGDASADGFVRSEGAGMVVLKRLSHAVAENDPVYAVIRGAAVNNDGQTSGFMVPSREGQRQMLRAAWKSAGVDPREIRFIEMHGTGTSVGDPVEIEAVGTALAEAGVMEPCALGSIKTNIGHTESASGVAGLIKAALALKHRMVPASLHCKTPNPKISWEKIPVRIAGEAIDLSGETKPILAGVNSFGLSGTNAHIVLEEAPIAGEAFAVSKTPEAAKTTPAAGPYLLPISARSPEALHALLRAYRAEIQNAGRQYPIRDACYTASARRDHHEYRAAVIGHDLEEMERNLTAAIDNEDSDGVVFDRAITSEHKIVFVAPGQGSQWVGMARELYPHDPVFRQAFEQCDAAIFAEAGWHLTERVLGPDAERYLSQIDVIQPALFAMSVALAAVWQSRGVKPDAVVGHSMGEVAAAQIAGILSLPDAVAVICRRSRLMKTLRSAGGMASIELPLDRVEELLLSSEKISIAASNGPNTTVISGDIRAVEALLKELESKEIYCRQIKVDVASHSSQVDPILDQLFVELKGIHPEPAKIPMLSTVTGDLIGGSGGTRTDAAYWVQNLRGSVLFAPAIEKLSRDGHDTFIELSPHPILLPSIEATARAVNPGAVAVASLRREKPEQATMLTGVVALHAAGRKITWEQIYPGQCRCVSLPQYPFQRERCWPEPADPARARQAVHADGTSVLLGHRLESSLQPGTFLWESELEIAALPYLDDHRVLRSAVFPAAGHVDLALSAAKSLLPEENFEVRDTAFISAAYIPDQGSKTFQIALTPDGNGGFSFEIRTRADEGEAAWPLRSKGILQRVDATATEPAAIDLSALQREYEIHRDASDHYDRTAKSGLQYGPAFQLVQEAWAGNSESLCRLRIPEDRDASVIYPPLLDACFQAMTHIRPEHESFRAEDTYLPVVIEQVRMYRPIPGEADLYSRARLVGADPLQGKIRANIQLLDAEGGVLMDILGMELQRVAREHLAACTDTLYSMEWVLQETSQSGLNKAETIVALLPRVSSENWIVFADNSGIAETMRTFLESAGGKCTIVKAGTKFRHVSETEFEIDPASRTDMDMLFEQVAIRSGVPTAVIHLLTLDNNSSQVYSSGMLVDSQAIGSQIVPGIVQAIASANWQNPPRLWLVTAGATAVDGSEGLLHIENSPMWGIGRTVVREHAELRATLVDLSAQVDPGEARSLVVQICLNGKEDRIALRGDKRYIARLRQFSALATEAQTHPLAESEDYRLEISSTGIIDNIELRGYASAAPGPTEITIETLQASLNFSDVTKVMGLYPGLIPGEPIPLGNEAAGRVTAVGRDVTEFKIGDEVIALTPSMRTTGMMASSVSVPAELAVRKPARLSMEEAASVAVVYLTAYWSLVEQARIRKGEWLLIHAGAGGVGLAAIEIAKWAGANIIATVGSKEKEEYLRSLGVRHVLNSRSLTFAAGVMEITGGRGVDIVLNSLAGEFLVKSMEVLAPYGRFIEMGKRDIYEDKRVGLKALRNNVSFHVVDIAAAVEDRRPYVAELLREIMRHIESGEWRPLPVQSFSSAEPSIPFRYMAQARHIGKIVLCMERDVQVLPPVERKLFSADATYLITGGLGGVALTVAEWMAANGAGHLVLLSRRKPTHESAEAIRRMEKSGATVISVQADITREPDLARVLDAVHATMPPLKGIMHTAAVVDDAMIRDVSPERFLPVMAPKIEGAWNLHTATLNEELDFFVLFSSIAAIHPQPGMGSYAAANAFLDAFAHYRRALGKPAISVNWGGWDQIGLARASGTGRSIEGYSQEGMRVFSAEEALDALRRSLESDPVQVIAVPIDSDKFVEFHGLGNIPPVFSDLVSRSRSNSNGSAAQSDRAEILDQLLIADSTTRQLEIFETYLQEVLGRVLKLATHKIDRARPLGSMGLDSLMGLEFVRRLSQSLQIAVPATVVFNYPTIQQLAAHLLRRMQLEVVENPVIAEAQFDPPSLNGNRSAGSGQLGIAELTISQPEISQMNGLSDAVSEEEALQALIGNEQRNS